MEEWLKRRGEGIEQHMMRFMSAIRYERTYYIGEEVREIRKN